MVKPFTSEDIKYYFLKLCLEGYFLLTEYVFKLYSWSHEKNSSIASVFQSTYPGTVTCQFTRTATDLEVKVTTSGGFGSAYEIGVIGQTIEPRLARLPFQLVQTAFFEGLTEGDKYTIIVLSYSKGERPIKQRQEYNLVLEPAEPVLNKPCFQSTDSSVTFSFAIVGVCHQLEIT